MNRKMAVVCDEARAKKEEREEERDRLVGEVDDGDALLRLRALGLELHTDERAPQPTLSGGGGVVRKPPMASKRAPMNMLRLVGKKRSTHVTLATQLATVLRTLLNWL